MGLVLIFNSSFLQKEQPAIIISWRKKTLSLKHTDFLEDLRNKHPQEEGLRGSGRQFLLNRRHLAMHEVKLFRALILGEPERGQNQYQALCFITRLNSNEIIPSESMARLRQKNPHAIRSAEERRTEDQLAMNVAVNLSRAWQLSAHVHNMCAEAQEAIYTREVDVKHWLDKGVEGSVFEILPQEEDVPDLQTCATSRDMWQACSCRYSLRLEWYPCLLKYCRSREGVSKGSPYKCGIKSCSKGYRFEYYVAHRHLCLWDEET
ncbi:out at first protein homolog isoform X2 [Paramormyrops kingsleyae]|uniref:out at first protein homolog isoform X2 n=1 Tax=Paramormyrops kingsleyae TaxID=1676925 RepID=UPI003B96D4B3